LLYNPFVWNQRDFGGMSDQKSGKLLLHACCAPCCGGVIESFLQDNIRPAVFFYNPNIYPRDEYELRKASLLAYIQRLGLSFIDADYDHACWLDAVKGHEQAPERGTRCSLCFDLRLACTARYAYQNGFETFATTNAVSRWKDRSQVHASGLKAAAVYPGLKFLECNWQTPAMQKLINQVSNREKFYRQRYCGCEYSRPENMAQN
jgi:predicted adenine nucleotide alpha hydrolase (AANH) superfamily ATPase